MQKKKIADFFIKCLFVISIVCITLLLSNVGRTLFRVISLGVSFLVAIIATFKFHILEVIFKEKKKSYWIVSVGFAIATALFFANCFYFYNMNTYPGRNIVDTYHIPICFIHLFIYLISIISLFALSSAYYYVFSHAFPMVKNFIANMDKIEKRFLLFFMVIMILLIVVLYNITNIFYAPMYNGSQQSHDIIYTTDTGALNILNTYMTVNTVENDLRQPLFAVFALPFSMVAYILAAPLTFTNNAYPILLNIIQVFLIGVSILLISKMLELKGKPKILFLLFFSLAYPTIVFSFNMEQYVFALFWLILFIYNYIINKKGNKLLFIGAVGSLLTTGILFPLLTKGKKMIQWLKDWISTGFGFIAITTVFGQLPIFLGIMKNAAFLSKYSSNSLTLADKILQYINFIGNCIMAPSHIEYTMQKDYPCFHLAPITSINIIGLVILTLAMISLFVNRKKVFAKICSAWIGFSFLLLAIAGWGSAENGLILYTFYFSWAFISLIFMLIQTLAKKYPKLTYTISTILIFLIIVWNLKGFWDILSFALTNYAI